MYDWATVAQPEEIGTFSSFLSFFIPAGITPLTLEATHNPAPIMFLVQPVVQSPISFSPSLLLLPRYLSLSLSSMVEHDHS